jgi:hypothetical protein
MINTNEFLCRLEYEVLKTRSVSELNCIAFADLSLESRAAYAQAMRFLGCESVETTPVATIPVPGSDRVRASKLMLLSLYLETSSPAWSSWMLDRLLEAVMGTPEASVVDLLRALQEVLEEYSCELTWPVRNLIRDMVIKCFSEHRPSYEAADWTWLVLKTIQRTTPAQAYLAYLAIPPEILTTQCAVAILKALDGTPYWSEAMNALEEDLPNSEARILNEIGAEGLRSEIQIGIEQADRGDVAPLDDQATLARVQGHRHTEGVG